MPCAVQYFKFTSRVAGTVFPRVLNADGSLKWTSRKMGARWAIEANQSGQIDLIRDAGCKPGDVVCAGLDVIWGIDASETTHRFVVGKNAVAIFSASGSVDNASLKFDAVAK